MVRIAVEHPFTSVRDALVQKGYNAEMLEKKTDATDYDVIVVRDQDDLTDFHMSVSLVEARGRTLFEIVEEVEERLVRQGKIQSPAPMSAEHGSDSGGAGSFVAGALTGALIGAAAGLLLAPKSGKELQEQVKVKTADSTEKVSGSIDQAKEKADELKAKREEKKEEKELDKQEKAIEKEAKQYEKAIEKEEKKEEKAQKEHEKAEKKVEKEIKKAEKDAGGVDVVEFGESSLDKNSDGTIKVEPTDAAKKNN
ncbi:YkuS family protein [Planococcus dechangensis]|uniref:YkuS family protein n=1 Tax=Planococcus dechangensis TaxID=1176255 RepID=A0ABV9ME41_9BACL